MNAHTTIATLHVNGPAPGLMLSCFAAVVGKHQNSNGTSFEVGDEVVYFRQRTQSTHSARVVAVDRAVIPYAYTVQVGQDLIDTEAEFLALPTGVLLVYYTLRTALPYTHLVYLQSVLNCTCLYAPVVAPLAVA
jgi:hypothetical protein